MLPAAAPVEQPARLAAPVVASPAAHEVSFGNIAGTVPSGTERVLVSVGGRVRAVKTPRGRRFLFYLALPPRDVTIAVTAVAPGGRRATTTVGPVFGLPPSAAPRATAAHEDPGLARTIRGLGRRFPGTSGIYVQDLRTGAGTAWNARARFPAASTLKLAIAVEVLRAASGKPPAGSRLRRLLHAMLAFSDNRAANELEVWLGGSTSAGSARVNAMMRTLGLTDSEMYGGYERSPSSAVRRRPIPLRVESQPRFAVGKYSTAADLARLLRYVHLAAAGKGALAQRFRGAFTPADARYLLYELAHVTEPHRLGRSLVGGGVAVLHKGGWIEHARHDNGLVYWRGGAFVATVMTWRAGGVGGSSDTLADRVARAALARLRGLRR